MKTLHLINNLLSHSEKKKAFYLFLLIVISAGVDMLGIATVMPLIAIVTDPEIIIRNQYLNILYLKSSYFGVNEINEFIIFFGIAIFLFLLFSIFLRFLTTYYSIKFGFMLEYSLGRNLLKSYLSRPYEWFINQNNSSFSKSILSEVNVIVGSSIIPMINIFVYGALAAFIIILLCIININIALISGLTLVVFYFLFYNQIKKKIYIAGEKRLEANELRYRSIKEAFGAIKDIKFKNIENEYLDYFSLPAKKYALAESLGFFLAQLPRYFIEAISFGGLIILILILLINNSNILSVLPYIGLYTFASYRLIPSLQQIYYSLSRLRYSSSSLKSISNEIKKIKNKNYIDENEDPLRFNHLIEFKNLTYLYPGSQIKALDNISLKIKCKSKVGIIGETGSGKSTFVQILIGLLKTFNGNLIIDGKIVDEQNIRKWQKNIGYVSQQIFLLDDSVKNNILLGSNKSQYIDENDIYNAAKAANIHDFIINQLPEGYETKVGDNGIKLSGGERQRIGIARAIIGKPKVLVLDEATSALDINTENKVISNILGLNLDMTIIMIAHRLDTVKNCDNIFLFNQGKLLDHGKLNQLNSRKK